MQFSGFRLFLESAGASGLTSVYIDSSSWNRLYDDHSQDRIRKEAKSVEDIINLIKSGDIRLIFSQALQEEMSRHPDIAYNAAHLAQEFVPRTPEVNYRGVQLHNKGLGPYDALHVASAEQGGADVLLTSDDRMIRKARSLGVHVRLENPMDWLRASGLARRAAALAHA
jgi:predicted nucleic acid-binding protein